MGNAGKGGCPEKFKALSLRTQQDEAGGAPKLQSRVMTESAVSCKQQTALKD